MKTTAAARLSVALLLVGVTFGQAQPARFEVARGKIRIQGSSNIDDWQVESRSVKGALEAGRGFPGAVGHESKRSRTRVQGTLFLEVSSLRSIEKDGKPFSNRMDEIMHEKLKVQQNPQIVYHLRDLVLKTAPGSANDSFEFEASGDLVVAGVTNAVVLPVAVLQAPDGQLRITGTTSLKMTDFKIDPPAPKIALGIVKTANSVNLSIDLAMSRQPVKPQER